MALVPSTTYITGIRASPRIGIYHYKKLPAGTNTFKVYITTTTPYQTNLKRLSPPPPPPPKPTTSSTVNKMDKGKSSENNTTIAPTNNSKIATDTGGSGGGEEKKEKQKKKPGFFARWKESTSKAYDAHRAAGGNL